MPEALDFQGVSVTRLAARLWHAPMSGNTMTDTKMRAIPTEDWNSSLSHIIADMKGIPLNVHKLLANNPALLDAWWSLRKYLVQGGSLGTRNAELVILRTAAHARNWYEWASHVERGLISDLSLVEIEQVLEGPSHPDWTESDAVRSMYVMLGNMLNTWEVELDKHVATALPDEVTRENFEGQFVDSELHS